MTEKKNFKKSKKKNTTTWHITHTHLKMRYLINDYWFVYYLKKKKIFNYKIFTLT